MSSAIGSEAPPASAVAWTSGAQVVVFTVQFAVAVPLSHLIAPSSFGTYAVVLVVFTAFALASDLSVHTVLARQGTLREEEVRTLHWAAVTVAAAAGATVFLLPGPVATLAGGDAAAGSVPYVRWLGVLLAVAGWQSAPKGLLIQRGGFAVLALSEAVPLVASYGVAVMVALWRPDSLALFAQLATFVALRASAQLAMATPPLLGPLAPSSLLRLLQFTKGVWSSNLVTFAARNLDNVVVGRVLGAHDLGLYSRAFTLLLAPLTQVQLALSSVMLRVFAVLGHDRRASDDFYCAVLAALAFSGFLLGGVLVVFASPLTAVLLGERWLEAVPLVRGFALTGPCLLLLLPGTWYLLALGRTTWLLALAVVGLLPLVGVALGVHGGLTRVALLSPVIGGLGTLLVGAGTLSAALGLPVRRLAEAVVEPILAALLPLGPALLVQGLASPLLAAVVSAVLVPVVAWWGTRRFVRPVFRSFSDQAGRRLAIQ